jgi:hypothetical protein
MSQRALDSQSPEAEPQGWGTGDSVFLGVVLAYSAFNVVLMLMYAASMLGPVPFDLIFLLLGVSAIGVIAALPIQLTFRHRGVTWRSALGVMVCFLALTVFNSLVLRSASGAV